MVKITLTESAWHDLDSITEYIALDSVRFAQEFSNRIFDKIEQLRDFPESGKVVLEYNNNFIRELVLGKYRVIYRIYSAKTIVILRIIHGSKLLN